MGNVGSSAHCGKVKPDELLFYCPQTLYNQQVEELSRSAIAMP